MSSYGLYCLVQDGSISSALAMEILQSYTKPSVYRPLRYKIHYTMAERQVL